MGLSAIRGIFWLFLAAIFLLFACQTHAIAQADISQDQNCQELNVWFLPLAKGPVRQRAFLVLQTNSSTTKMETSFEGQYTVLGSAMPWLWKANGLNSAYQFGLQDGTGPTMVALSTLKAEAGQSLTIKYLSGEVDVGGIFPPSDANGVNSPYSYGGDGSSGQPFPSQYMQPYPINLGALVGVFTDDTGSIVDRPFAIGDGPVSRIIPSGACQLQLGINDDIYGNTNGRANTGGFNVAIFVTTSDGAMPDDGEK